MIYEKIYLHENEKDVYLEYFGCDDFEKQKRPAILICPGGGYEFCWQGEGGPIARFFESKGFNCAVLMYSTKEKASMLMPKASRPLLEASMSVSLMRKNADKWNILSDKIAVIGFSAGGHVAGSLGTLWDDDSIFEFLDIERGSNKPNALILSYSVLRSDEYAHRGSFDALLGEYKENKELLEKYDITKQVSEKTPPTFLWHTYDDGAVAVENSIEFCKQMRLKSNNKCELHIFYEGVHGSSLCTGEVGHRIDHNAHWSELCAEWLKAVFKDV